MIPPYLGSDDLRPHMVFKPNGAFLVRPRHYTIIDGDTFRIRTGVQADGKRYEAFRIRLQSIDTPELQKPWLFGPVLDAGGHDPFRHGPGEAARDYLRKLCAGRVLLVAPGRDRNGAVSTDVYGRLVAQVTASGAPGDLFRLNGARSVERALHAAGFAMVMPGHELPPAEPEILSRIRDTVLEISADEDPLPSPA